MATKKNLKDTTVKSLAEMKLEVVELQKSLLEAKQSHRLGELVNPKSLNVTRKEIARLLTKIRLSANESEKENK